MTLMLILRHDHVTLYIGTCLFGLFLSSITPTALSVAEMYVQLSGQSYTVTQKNRILLPTSAILAKRTAI